MAAVKIHLIIHIMLIRQKSRQFARAVIPPASAIRWSAAVYLIFIRLRRTYPTHHPEIRNPVILVYG